MIRLQPFAYHQPEDLAEACRLLAELPQAQALAGGTDLLVRMKRGVVAPAAVVNLKGIPGMADIQYSQEGVLVGSLTTAARLAADPRLGRTHAVLAEAAGSLGAPGIRSLATLGGNVFRASPASDLVPALMALDAKVRTQGPLGVQEYPAGEICTGPGATCLFPGQIITGLWLPASGPRQGGTYVKHCRRKGLDLALAGVAMWLELDPSARRVTRARVALSAVGPTPLRAREAEDVLMSRDWDRDLLAQAGEVAAAGCKPLSDLRASAQYRRDLVRVLVARAAQTCLARAMVA